MDWTTGLWFEFDDDNVTFLENGPNHTFDARNSGCDFEVINRVNNRTKKKKGGRGSLSNTEKESRGCSLAYSLSYVERSFLGKYGAMQIHQNNSTYQRHDLFTWIQNKRKHHEHSLSQ